MNNCYQMLFVLNNLKKLASVMNMGPPFFVGFDSLDPIEVESGTKFEYNLPKVSDPDKSDKILISVLLKNAYEFVSYANQNKIIISPKPSHVKNLPFKVQIVLTDNNPMPKSSSYDLFILVKPSTTLSKSALKKSIIEI